MDDFKRFAVYWAPAPGAFALAAAHWLGWQPETAIAMVQPVVQGLPRPLGELTADPRKYGFHGTMKAPFRLAEGLNRADLSAALARFCAQSAPVTLAGLHLTRIERFLALTPQGDATPLNDLAARVVADLDPCRAPLTAAEIARRRPETLTPHQRDLLARFGYPYVLDHFQFHLTLSGPLTDAEAVALRPHAEVFFQPLLPRPFHVDSLCLFGEAVSGQFHLLERHALTG